MIPLLLLILSASADTIFGVDWVPAGRGDLAWIEAGELSGELVGEFDGLLVPPLTAWGGWTDAHNAALFGLAGARLASHATGDATESIDVVATLRLSADYRRYLLPRQPGLPVPWVQAGVYGVIPSVRSESSALTVEEQAATDEASGEIAARVGGVGGRAGVGAELLWDNGLSLGARAAAVAHRAASELEDTTTVSTWIHGEAAIVLSFTFGGVDKDAGALAPSPVQ